MDIGRSIMNPNFTIRMTIDPKNLILNALKGLFLYFIYCNAIEEQFVTYYILMSYNINLPFNFFNAKFKINYKKLINYINYFIFFFLPLKYLYLL